MGTILILRRTIVDAGERNDPAGFADDDPRHVRPRPAFAATPGLDRAHRSAEKLSGLLVANLGDEIGECHVHAL